MTFTCHRFLKSTSKALWDWIKAGCPVYTLGPPVVGVPTGTGIGFGTGKAGAVGQVPGAGAGHGVPLGDLSAYLAARGQTLTPAGVSSGILQSGIALGLSTAQIAAALAVTPGYLAPQPMPAPAPQPFTPAPAPQPTPSSLPAPRAFIAPPPGSGLAAIEAAQLAPMGEPRPKTLAEQIGAQAGRIAGGLGGGFIGGQIAGPPGAVIGLEVGQQIGRVAGQEIGSIIQPPVVQRAPTFAQPGTLPPPPSFVAFQAQRGVVQPQPVSISRPAGLRSQSAPLAPIVGQNYCPECDPVMANLRAQLEQVQSALQREQQQLQTSRSQQQQQRVRQLEAHQRQLQQQQRNLQQRRLQQIEQQTGQQQQQIEQLQQQEQQSQRQIEQDGSRPPGAQHDTEQQIQHSIQEKQRLLDTISNELQQLEQMQQQRPQQPTGTQGFSPCEQSCIEQYPNPDSFEYDRCVQNCEHPAMLPQRQQTQQTGHPAVTFCVGCQSQSDAFQFLNGEPAACSVIPNAQPAQV